jgi:hypothetical protein
VRDINLDLDRLKEAKKCVTTDLIHDKMPTPFVRINRIRHPPFFGHKEIKKQRDIVHAIT